MITGVGCGRCCSIHPGSGPHVFVWGGKTEHKDVNPVATIRLKKTNLGNENYSCLCPLAMLLGIIYVVPIITVAQLLGRDLLAFIRLCLKYHQMEFQYC